MKHELICKCDNAFYVDVPEKILLTDASPVLTEIKDNSFMQYTCPHCGQVTATEFQTHFTWDTTTKHHNFLFLPEPMRFSFLTETATLNIPSGADIVIGFPELKERITIIEADLDAVAIESLKIVITEKILESTSADHVAVYFNEKNDDALIFHITGIRNDEIAVIKLPYTMYADIKTKLLTERDNPPYAMLFHNGYCSVKNIDFEE